MTETKESVQAERDQLRRDNEALTRQVEDLSRQLEQARTTSDSPGASTPVDRRRPKAGPPSYQLSEGERADLASRGVATSPWTGEVLIADEQGVETTTDEAREAAERARTARDAKAAGPDRPDQTPPDQTPRT